MAAEPTSIELADDLAGSLRHAGDRVMSEHELAAVRGVSATTARAALDELERRYLVRRVAGHGTVVSRRIDVVISTDTAPSTSAALRMAGGAPETELLGMRTVAAPADVALHLDVERSTPVVHLHRRVRLDGAITAWTSTYLLERLVPDLSGSMTLRSSLFDTLRSHYGIVAQRRWTRASLEVPTDPVVAALDLDGRPPTWLLEGVNHDRADPRQAVEFSRSWMRADAINVVFEMGRPPSIVR